MDGQIPIYRGHRLRSGCGIQYSGHPMVETLSPSSQKAGQRPRPAGILVRAAMLAWVNSIFPWVLMQPETKSKRVPCGVTT